MYTTCQLVYLSSIPKVVHACTEAVDVACMSVSVLGKGLATPWLEKMQSTWVLSLPLQKRAKCGSARNGGLSATLQSRHCVPARSRKAICNPCDKFKLTSAAQQERITLPLLLHGWTDPAVLPKSLVAAPFQRTKAAKCRNCTQRAQLHAQQQDEGTVTSMMDMMDRY